MKRLGRAALAAAFVSTAACFATQQDVQSLQSDVQSMRQESARSDSVRAQQLAQLSAVLGTVNDSIRALGLRLAKFQGDVRGDLFAMGQQLIAVQELTGQSQQRLQELRSSLEQRGREAAAPPPGLASDSTAARALGGGAAAGGAGPNQLFQASLDQLRRGSAGTARSGFTQLLRQYATADVAPAAQFYLAEAYSAEGNAAAADTAYAAVVTRYPQSPQAPTALYKRALAQEAKGNLTAARAALNQLIQKYPRSDEAALARERLRTLR